MGKRRRTSAIIRDVDERREVVAAFASVLDKARAHLDADEIEVLSSIETFLPGLPGRSRDQQAKVVDAEVKRFWDAEMERLKHLPTAERYAQTAIAIRKRWPRYEAKSTKTITGRMQRR